MNKRVVIFIILSFLMTFCSPSEIDFDKRAKKYLAKNMAEWFIRSPRQIDKIICCHDGQVLVHNLKSNSDSLIYLSRNNRALTLTAESDSVFYFMDGWLVYGYSIDQNRLFDVWDEICSEGVYLTAVNKYILYIKTNDDLQDNLLAPEDEVIVYNYIEDTRIPLVFKTDKGKTINRRRLLRSESTFHINIEGGTLLFDRYYNNGSCIELYKYNPLLSDIVEAKYVAGGKLIRSGIENNKEFFIIDTDEGDYKKYNNLGKVIELVPTAKSFIEKQSIPKNDIVAMTDREVYYFRTKQENFYEYSALYRYDVLNQQTQEFDKLTLDGKQVTVSVNSARLSKDGRSIIVNCSSSSEAFLFRWVGSGISLLARGQSVTTTDTFYTVLGRNGSSQYYDLNGNEISEYEAGASALGLSDYDILNLLF